MTRKQIKRLPCPASVLTEVGIRRCGAPLEKVRLLAKSHPLPGDDGYVRTRCTGRPVQHILCAPVTDLWTQVELAGAYFDRLDPDEQATLGRAAHELWCVLQYGPSGIDPGAPRRLIAALAPFVDKHPEFSFSVWESLCEVRLDALRRQCVLTA